MGTAHCSKCGGVGTVGVPKKTCPTCKGKGFVKT